VAVVLHEGRDEIEQRESSEIAGTMKLSLSLSLPLASLCKAPSFLNPPTSFLQKGHLNSLRGSTKWNPCNGRRAGIVCGLPLPVDPWAPTIDSQSIASQLFAFSLFPYIGFLYFITKSKTAPNLTLFGFYFLLAFVGATSQFLSPCLFRCFNSTTLSDFICFQSFLSWLREIEQYQLEFTVSFKLISSKMMLNLKKMGV